MDITLHYIEKGAGTPFVMLHGNSESSKCFVHQMDYFAKDYRVIAIDTRGHGKSPRGEKPFTIQQFAQDLKNFFEEKNLNHVILLGFSDGGNIALEFAIKYPEYVNKLILNGANLNPKGVKAFVQLPICIGYAITSMVALWNKGAKAKKEMLGLMVTQPALKERELAQIDIPTLVIAGTHDMIKQKHTQQIASCIKDSTLCIMSGDHFIAYKNSSEFNKRVDEFLTY